MAGCVEQNSSKQPAVSELIRRGPWEGAPLTQLIQKVLDAEVILGILQNLHYGRLQLLIARAFRILSLFRVPFGLAHTPLGPLFITTIPHLITLNRENPSVWTIPSIPALALLYIQ